MARRLRYPSLENRTARLKLVVRRKPYPGPTLARGVLLLYRRNKGNGSWVLKASDGRGKYWTKAIGEADDFDASNADTILTFYEAQDTAKQLARGGKGVGAAAPVTVDHALIDYKADLMSRGARGYNADRPRVHLPPLLLAKPVALLTSKELKIWRDGLLGTTESLPPRRLALTIQEFCDSFRFTEGFYYKLKKQGLGPREMKIGTRTLISVDSAVEWGREHEIAGPGEPAEHPDPNQ